MLGGVFDRFPTATVVLGHLGEMLPFAVWRLQHRFDLRPHGRQRDRAIGDYLRENFYVTTSGNFASRPLAATVQEMGALTACCSRWTTRTSRCPRAAPGSTRPRSMRPTG